MPLGHGADQGSQCRGGGEEAEEAGKGLALGGERHRAPGSFLSASISVLFLYLTSRSKASLREEATATGGSIRTAQFSGPRVDSKHWESLLLLGCLFTPCFR